MANSPTATQATPFDLSKLRRNTSMTVLTGLESAKWECIFHVLEPISEDRAYPRGVLVAKSPAGVLSPELEVSLVGSGKWTTKQENPGQDRQREFTIGEGVLKVGSFMVAIKTHNILFMRFDGNDKEIAAIEYDF